MMRELTTSRASLDKSISQMRQSETPPFRPRLFFPGPTPACLRMSRDCEVPRGSLPRLSPIPGVGHAQTFDPLEIDGIAGREG